MPHLFRQEYAKMTAVLCRHFGLKHIEIAEDIASDTFLKASEHWATEGIPQNPTAWLYAVAKNKAKDYFKHLSIFETQVTDTLKTDEHNDENSFEISNSSISDSQLAMIFAVCNPANSAEAQICLALQILCGFSVEEIANAFLSRPETIKKRLSRARENLRNDNFQIKALSETEIKPRTDIVLKTLYLMFNEGYFSKTDKQQIRIDLCSEATRLALLLTENALTNTPQTNALLSLMCYQSSRLQARADHKGEPVLFDQQNKALWNQMLIEKGNYYFANACKGDQISSYHLEAAIAYKHTIAESPSKWAEILNLYNQLIILEYSPMAALSRGFAFSKVYGHEKAIQEVQKLGLAESHYYHKLLGYLHAETNPDKAIGHYRLAIGLTKSKIEIKAITKEMERLKEKINR